MMEGDLLDFGSTSKASTASAPVGIATSYGPKNNGQSASLFATPPRKAADLPPLHNAKSNGNDFDAWWEGIGGSPRPSATAAAVLPKTKSSHALKNNTSKSASTVSNDSFPFDAFPASRTSKDTSTSVSTSNIDFSTFEAAPKRSSGHGGVELLAHEEEAEEHADEDVDELTHELQAQVNVVGHVHGHGADHKPMIKLPADNGGDWSDMPAPHAAEEGLAVRNAASEVLEGPLYMRVSTFLLKKWKEKYGALRRGVISVWNDRSSMMRGDEAIETVVLNEHMALSTMKVASTGDTRVFYRYISELEPGVALATVGGQFTLDDENQAGVKRVFKFGCNSQAEFEKWSRSIRMAIERLGAESREKNTRTLALDSATNAADLFRSAIASPKERAKRRSSIMKGPVSSGGTLHISLKLLDGTSHSVIVSKGATVKDVLVALRRLLALQADADYSLYLRQKDASGRDVFACLPDVMSAEEAEALALPENRDLVYKRRIYLPPVADGAGDFDPVDVDDVDAEAERAHNPLEAAHSLAYMDAVYNVVNGNYLLPLQDAIILAGLHAVTLIGKWSDADASALAADPRYKLDVYKSHLSQLIAAQSIAEHKATSGKGVEDLLSSIRGEHIRLAGSLDLLAAQKVYIKRVKQLPEFGATFYAAELVRLTADGTSKGSKSAPATPDWAEDLTTDDSHGSSAPAPLPVLVAINAVGVFTRPLPPAHSPALSYNYSACPPAHGPKTAVPLGHEASPSEKLSEDGKPVPWMLHPVHYIEVWGVKARRPCWVYRARERFVRNIELTTPSYKEMSSNLHMFVFALLAQREGKPKRSARAEASDYGTIAEATKHAVREAEARAKSDLPSGWSEIVDPITGSVAFWNAITKQTVFSRPTQ